MGSAYLVLQTLILGLVFVSHKDIVWGPKEIIIYIASIIKSLFDPSQIFLRYRVVAMQRHILYAKAISDATGS